MSAAIKQVVTVREGGLVEVRSSELHEGDQAEVTIVVQQKSGNGHAAAGNWKRFAGAWNSGNARAADNTSIDADLFGEYGGRSKAGS